MTTATACWIECDGFEDERCDAQYPTDLGCATRAEARNIARKAGWSLGRDGSNKDYCPDCAKGRSE